MNFREICQKFVDLEFDERVNIGRNAFVATFDGLLAAGVKKDDVPAIIRAMIRIAVSGDLNCSEEEWRLYNAIFDDDMSSDDFYEMTNGGASVKLIAAVDGVVDSLSSDAKAAAVTLIAVFLSADDTLTPAEQGLLARLIED